MSFDSQVAMTLQIQNQSKRQKILQNSGYRFGQEKSTGFSEAESGQQRERTKPSSSWTQDKGPNKGGIVNMPLPTKTDHKH